MKPVDVKPATYIFFGVRISKKIWDLTLLISYESQNTEFSFQRDTNLIRKKVLRRSYTSMGTMGIYNRKP